MKKITPKRREELVGLARRIARDYTRGGVRYRGFASYKIMMRDLELSMTEYPDPEGDALLPDVIRINTEIADYPDTPEEEEILTSELTLAVEALKDVEINKQQDSIKELVRMLADDLREDVKAIHAMNLDGREARWLALRLTKRGRTKEGAVKYNSLDQIAEAMGEHRQAIHRLEVKMHSRKDVSNFLESRLVPDRVTRGVTKRKKDS